MKTILLQVCVTALFFSTTFSFAQSISGGGPHSIALCNDGTVKSWGNNNYGQMGDGTLVNKAVPTTVGSSLANVITVGGGDLHSFFVKNDGTVWACGRNFYGQLGDGTTSDKSSPVLIGSITNVVKADGGYDHSLFVKADKTAWSCGANADGRLGNGTTIPSTTPVAVSSLSGIIEVAAGNYHSLFLKDNGTVWACGGNSQGQLGDGSNINKSTPVQISSLTGIIAIAAGYTHSMFLKNDGTVWACGQNNYGQLGNGTTGSTNTPIQVVGLTGQIVGIAAGLAHSLFIKNNNKVWACGKNSDGQLGDGTTVQKTTPVQVNTVDGIIGIAGGGVWSSDNGHSLFLKNDGTLWACGSGSSGQLGNAGTTNTSSPVQVIALCQVAIGVNEQINNEIKINIFPNPNSGKFTINIEQLPGTEQAFSITDLLGREVLNTKLHNTKQEIDISNQKAGIYFLRIGNTVKQIIKE